jgi:hypothetical protein
LSIIDNNWVDLFYIARAISGIGTFSAEHEQVAARESCIISHMRRFALRSAALAFVICFTLQADACQWAVGFFHQVTCLKGKVVGKSLGPMQFRWLRRSFSVSGAKLELYEYQDPWQEGRKPLAHAFANSSGEFEFIALKEGHYNLQIKGGGMEDWFDIEITNKVPTTKQVIIDISPNFPDCTGGHEIDVQAEKK